MADIVEKIVDLFKSKLYDVHPELYFGFRNALIELFDEQDKLK